MSQIQKTEEPAQATIAKFYADIKALTSESRDEYKLADSKALFETLIEFISSLKKLDSTQEVMAGKHYKNSYEETLESLDVCFVFELVVNQNFDKFFNSNKKSDWLRSFRFCNKIQVTLVEIESPLIRNAIRAKNRAFFAGLQIPHSARDFAKNPASHPEVFLILLELGLYCPTDLTDVKENLTRQMKQLLEEIRDEDRKCNEMAIDDKSRILKFISEIVSSGKSDLTVVRSYDLMKKLHLYHTYLRIVLHLIMLHNDEQFGSLDKESYFYVEKDLLEMSRQILENLDAIISVKESKAFAVAPIVKPIVEEINRLILMAIHPVKDFYAQSMAQLAAELPENKHSQSMWLERTYLIDSFGSRFGVKVERLNSIILQILENYYLLKKFGYSEDLKNKIDPEFKQLAVEANDYDFRLYFTVNNGICSTLLLLHQIATCFRDHFFDREPQTVTEKNPSNRSILIGIQLLCKIITGNSAACAQLFKKRPFSHLKRLAWIDLRSTGLLLLHLTTECMQTIQKSLFIGNLLTDLFLKLINHHLGDLVVSSSPTDKKQAKVGRSNTLPLEEEKPQPQHKSFLPLDKNVMVGIILLCEAMKKLLHNSSDKYFQQAMQIKIQEGIGNIVDQMCLRRLFEQGSWYNLPNLQVDISSFILAAQGGNLAAYCAEEDWASIAPANLSMQVYFFVTSLLSESVLGIESSKTKQSIRYMFKEQKEQKLQNLHFSELHQGVSLFFEDRCGLLYLLEVVRLYTNTVALEVGPYDRSLTFIEHKPNNFFKALSQNEKFRSTNQKRNLAANSSPRHTSYQTSIQTPDPSQEKKKKQDKRKSCTEVFKSLSDQILKILNLQLDYANKSCFNSETTNKRFMYRGFLRLLAKFAYGASFERDNIILKEIGCKSLYEQLVDRKDFILDMCCIARDKRDAFNPDHMDAFNTTKIKAQEKLDISSQDRTEISNFIIYVTSIIEIINALYQQSPEFLPEIQIYTREMEAGTTKTPKPVLSNMNDLGSLSLLKLKTRIEAKPSKNHSQNLLDRLRMKKLKFNIHSLDQKIMRFEQLKKKSLSDVDSELLEMLDENNTISDSSYKYIIDWIMSFVDFVLTQEEDADGSLFIRDPFVTHLVTVFGNLLSLRPFTRKIYYSAYFERFEDEEDSNSQKQASKKGRSFLDLLIQSAQMFQKKIKNSIFTSENRMACERYFLICLTLVEIVEGNQVNRLKELVGQNVTQEDDEDYLYQAAGLVGGLMLPGQEQRAGDEQGPSVLKKLFRGLIFNTGDQESLLPVKDRDDLVWYNIVTLWTLTEYLSGPCTQNQIKTVDPADYFKIFSVLAKGHSDLNHINYHLQEAVTVFLSSLFEQSDNEQDRQALSANFRQLAEKVSPKVFLETICSHISRLAKSNTWGLQEITVGGLINLYKKNEEFNSHPSVSIAVKLFFIMMALSEQSTKYRKFVEAKAKQILKENISYEGNLFGLVTGAGNQDKPADSQTFKQENKLNEKEALATLKILLFIQKITAKVEVLVATPDQKDLNRVEIYFPKMPETLYITEKYKENFLSECSFSDSNSKVSDLMNFVSEYYIVMQSTRTLLTKYPVVAVFAEEDAYYVFKLLLWWIGLALNILLILGLEIDEKPKIKSLGILLTINILNFVILGIAGFSLVMWMTFKYPINLRIEENVIQNEVELEKEEYTDTWRIYRAILEGSKKLGKLYKKYLHRSLMIELAPMCFFLHIFCCLLYMLYGPFFIGFHLLSIVFTSKTTRYVIKSISQHYDQLLTTFFLTVIAIYCFSFIIMLTFSNLFADSGTPEDLHKCNQLSSCFFYVTDLGLRQGGGIADVMKPIAQGNSLFIYKLILNLMFFGLINLVSLNIVFGIILDTFAELRDEQQERGKLA